MRKRRKKKLAPMSSKLEDEVAEALDSIGVKYRRQSVLYSDEGWVAGIFDFYLPTSNVAVEVNGTYWHSDPRIYPDGPETRDQRYVQTRWKRKLKYAKMAGIKIIVLWELDLRKDMIGTIKKALKKK